MIFEQDEYQIFVFSIVAMFDVPVSWTLALCQMLKYCINLTYYDCGVVADD
jgi:hypothetical protein